MGGYGSTRWNDHNKKYTVEHCLSFDVSILHHEGLLREGIHQFGQLSWFDSFTRECTFSIGYEVNTTNLAHPWIRLFYTIARTGDRVDYKIQLTTTPPNFGGLRWWFICPLSVNSRSCYRRVGKLYLPHYARFYGCRHCYGLTYRSCQESDKRVYSLRRNPDALMGILQNLDGVDESKLFLAMKALKRRFA